jgi:hypothetical protein
MQSHRESIGKICVLQDKVQLSTLIFIQTVTFSRSIAMYHCGECFKLRFSCVMELQNSEINICSV